jgi:hypothetical protein
VPRGPCTFRQQDVTRAIRAAMAAGAKVARIEIDRTGRIVLITEAAGTSETMPQAENEWDRQ